jgi:hypothetical protein
VHYGLFLHHFLEFCHDDSYLDHGLYPCFCRDHDPVIWILIGDPVVGLENDLCRDPDLDLLGPDYSDLRDLYYDLDL